MDIRKLTGVVVMATIVILSLYDVYAYTEGGTEGTISHLILSWSYAHPAFTFSMGFLMGHIFWRIRENPKQS